LPSLQMIRLSVSVVGVGFGDEGSSLLDEHAASSMLQIQIKRYFFIIVDI
jgi:hypothetical protein